MFNPAVGEGVQHPLPGSRCFASHERLGHLDLRHGDGGVERCLAVLALDRVAPRPRQAALADLLAQLVQRVEASGVVCEVVVERRELLLA